MLPDPSNKPIAATFEIARGAAVGAIYALPNETIEDPSQGPGVPTSTSPLPRGADRPEAQARDPERPGRGPTGVVQLVPPVCAVVPRP